MLAFQGCGAAGKLGSQTRFVEMGIESSEDLRIYQLWRTSGTYRFKAGAMGSKQDLNVVAGRRCMQNQEGKT